MKAGSQTQLFLCDVRIVSNVLVFAGSADRLLHRRQRVPLRPRCSRCVLVFRMPNSTVSCVQVEHLNELANISDGVDSPPAVERGSAALLPENRFGQRDKFFFNVPILHWIVGMAQGIDDFDHMARSVESRRNDSDQRLLGQHSFD